jgi:hypothetical protein
MYASTVGIRVISVGGQRWAAGREVFGSIPLTCNLALDWLLCIPKFPYLRSDWSSLV